MESNITVNKNAIAFGITGATLKKSCHERFLQMSLTELIKQKNSVLILT